MREKAQNIYRMLYKYHESLADTVLPSITKLTFANLCTVAY